MAVKNFNVEKKGSFFLNAGLGSRSRSEPVLFGSLEPEPEPLEKKRGAGAAWKKKSSLMAFKNFNVEKKGSFFLNGLALYPPPPS